MGNCLSSESKPIYAAYNNSQTQTQNQNRSLNGVEPSLNFNRTTPLALSKEEKRRWRAIFDQGHESIVDPEDIHTMLESTIWDTINNLQPAEMTLILRRCRKVVGSLENQSLALPKTKKKIIMDPATKSTVMYKKEHLLDLNVMKSVFIAGDRWLSRGRDEDWMAKSLENYLIENANGQTNKNANDHNRTRADLSKNTNTNGKKRADGVRSNGDLIKAAYTLLLHMSEKRWDQVQAIAKQSAAEAGLELDVNQQVKAKQKEEKEGNSQGKTTPSPMAKHPYTKFELEQPENPNGVTFQALSYLIAVALRSGRRQRLMLLFHLLLGSEKLESILNEHPAGGVPSWILECGQNWKLSYASLSHEYHYKDSIKVDAMAAIETIGILLHCTPPKRSNVPGDSNLDNGNGSPSANGQAQSNRRRVLSYGEKKYNAAKMHAMLSVYLRGVRSGKDVYVFENEKEQKWRWDLLGNFFKGSLNEYKKGVSWTFDQFISWADDAISNDEALDIIMHQLFGMGLLPTAAMERKLVADSWVDWQLQEASRSDGTNFNDYSDPISAMANGLINLLSFSSKDTDLSYSSSSANLSRENFDVDGSAVWGGIGGFDGRGGLGHGIMYCVDKLWWDKWTGFVGWEWDGLERNNKLRSRKRPLDLSSERLLDRSPDIVPGGSMGSYEFMRHKLKKDVDYVLVPPCVWDILYELYAGGPPLPRMIIKRIADNASIDVSTKERLNKPLRIPRSLNVETHPWIIECNVCDPHQPYRRGDVGPMSIRLMATVDQPLWRLFAEIVLRLPIVHPRGKDSDDKGRGRLWKLIDEHDDGSESEDEDESPSRYGPWELLVKGAADFPVGENLNLDQSAYSAFVKSWNSYAKQQTVSDVGLKDGSRLMFEYSLHGKDGKIAWPREAAAKAGMKQKDNAEEHGFRRMLRGLGIDGNLISDVKSIIGTVVDAMDSAGRWYQAEIADIDCHSDSSYNSDTSSVTEVEEVPNETQQAGEIRAVKIDFRDIGGHEEWILVGSDRLAIRDRFTLDSMKSIRLEEMDNGTNGKSNGESKLGFVLKRHTSKEPSPFRLSNTVCSFPGFGACGLVNLGNTCYANSAIQCISYLPLLRSYLLSGQFKKYGDINKDNVLGTGGKLLEEVSALQQLMWSGKNGVRSPFKFRAQLSRALNQYAGTEQQDAQELLNDLLDSLHEDSNKVVNKPIVEGLEDIWVEANDLNRVGEESWRRWLRRNRSIVANIAMGQVLNRVTCATCNYTNRKFDPFNMLSIPFPTISDVVFKCRLLRRATPFNCPETLGLKSPKKGGLHNTVKHSPSHQLIAEDHTITMSRLDDIADLKQKLSDLCSLPPDSLRFFIVDENENDEMQGSTNKLVKLTKFPDKEGPCLSLAKESFPEDFFSPAQVPTQVLAFESTLHSGPNNAENEEASKKPSFNSAPTEGTIKALACSFDANEHLVGDADPSYLAKVLWQSQWPETVKDISPGLRVDAIDHQKAWFSGTVIEILNKTNGVKPNEARIKVHFDNFSRKWDLMYTFTDFAKGDIQPLYSRSKSRYKLLEFQIFHSTVDQPEMYFSYPFLASCYPDWSIARAGAHILSQASRFLEQNEKKDTEIYKILKESRNAISDAIEYILAADRDYVHRHFAAVANNETFDGSLIAGKLETNLLTVLSKLPFELAFCGIKNESEEFDGVTEFQFSLDKIIGNRMSAAHGIVLRWKRWGKSSLTLFSDPLGKDAFGKQSPSSSDKGDGTNSNEKVTYSNGGMKLGVCLDEFCKEQNLGEDGSWRCPKCKGFREGRQSMALWRLPDLLTFHLKRFNCSARYREKITTKVVFPLTGLNMKEWCDKDSPHTSDASCIYDLVGVVHHYGGMTGGHYVATCKVSSCSPEGNEEVEHNFNGAGVHAFGAKEAVSQASAPWKLGRNKEKELANTYTRAAMSKAKTATESSEPLWLQFDDDSVEPIPPRNVNAESAYVLFYRRRQISPSSISSYAAMN